MGYDDGAGDFTFAASLDKAVEIGMMTRASADCILQKQYALYRGDLVDLSVSALTTPCEKRRIYMGGRPGTGPDRRRAGVLCPFLSAEYRRAKA